MLPAKDAVPVPPVAEAVDWSHLDRAALGDPVLTREVLGLFVEQVDAFALQIEEVSEGMPALVHRLKGAARAIGAWPIADAAQALERHFAAHDDLSQPIAVLQQRIATARSAIGAHLAGEVASAGAAQTDSL